MNETPADKKPQPRRRRSFDWAAVVILIVVVGAATYVYLRDGVERFLDVLWHDLGLFGDMAPKVLAGTLIAAFLTILMPREVINRWVGAESGIKGILVATLAGIVVPGGPFTIFPIAAAFIAVGADIGAAIALITSWTLLGLNRAVVWEMPFFGLDFVGWRMLAALPLPILAGLLARILLQALVKREQKA